MLETCRQPRLGEPPLTPKRTAERKRRTNHPPGSTLPMLAMRAISLFRSSSSVDRRFPMLSTRAISLFRSSSYLWLGSIASSHLKLFCFTLEHPDGLRYSPPPRACPAQGLECWYYLSSNGCIGRVRHLDISARDVGDTNPVQWGRCAVRHLTDKTRTSSLPSWQSKLRGHSILYRPFGTETPICHLHLTPTNGDTRR